MWFFRPKRRGIQDGIVGLLKKSTYLFTQESSEPSCSYFLSLGTKNLYFCLLIALFEIAFPKSAPHSQTNKTFKKCILYLNHLWHVPECRWVTSKSFLHHLMRQGMLEIIRYFWHSVSFYLAYYYCKSCPIYKAFS